MSAQSDDIARAALKIGQGMGILAKASMGRPETVTSLYWQVLSLIPRTQMLAYIKDTNPAAPADPACSTTY